LAGEGYRPARGNSIIAALLITVLMACFVVLTLVAGNGVAAASEAVSGRRAALVVGNSAYEHLGKLPNAVNDADRIRDVLERANFEVTLGKDLDKKGLEETILGFLRSLNDGDVALFYYSGHAVQVAGRNYMLPIDATLATSYDLEVEAYSLSDLLEYMRESSSLQIAILDACRDNPFGSDSYYVGQQKVAVEGKKGLASVTPDSGTLIVYSTAPDQVAMDGTGSLSPFTGSFADHALKPNVEIRKLLSDIRSDVIARTDGRQTPWDASSLTNSFFFVTRQNLLIIEDMREVRTPPRSKEVALRISPPITSGDTPLTVSFTKLPDKGSLWLADKKLDLETRVEADRIEDVVFRPGSDDMTSDEVRYAVTTDTGRSASGIVKVVVDPQMVAEKTIKPKLAIQAGVEEKPEPPASAKPILVAMASDIGTGFAAMPNEVVRSSDAPRGGWLRLEARDPETQVAVGTDIISEGDLIKAEDIGKLRIRPSLRVIGAAEEPAAKPATAPAASSKNEVAKNESAESEGVKNESVESEGATPAAEPAVSLPVRTVTLVPAVKQAVPAPITINVAVSVNECDTLAAEPLDVQAVSKGVLPNDIDIPRALEACKAAVSQYPDVARFNFQYARALYANGDFEAALNQLNASYEAGHVRAGELLGRLYQLGAAVERDPARAIPLFEAGAQKGDPYSQYALGRAFLEGKGTTVNVDRGMTLLTSAAESGHTYAMNQLGWEYHTGEHVTKDDARALRFFTESTERNDIYGMANLGILYRDGAGVEKDPNRAMELFKKANDEGHPYAGTLLGMMAEENHSADAPTLLALFRQSAERGDAWGAFFAGDILKKVPALQRDSGEMVRLYALSASQETPKISDRAKAALNGADKRIVGMEVQQALRRMGQNVGTIDGVIGEKSRQAVATVLGQAAPKKPQEMLIALLHKEWIDSRPRLDML
jgi:hypothetical protein